MAELHLLWVKAVPDFCGQKYMKMELFGFALLLAETAILLALIWALHKSQTELEAIKMFGFVVVFAIYNSQSRDRK